MQPGAQLSTSEQTVTNVNTELSAVVKYLTKLNDSGVANATTDREKAQRRAAEIARQQEVVHSV